MAKTEGLVSREEVKRVLCELCKFNLLAAFSFELNVNLGLRASDLLGLKFSDFDGNRSHLKIVEQKTGKSKKVKITDSTRRVVRRLKEHFNSKGVNAVYLFQATGNRVGNRIKPISYEYMWRFYRKVAKKLDIAFATHTPRKTRATIMYNDGIPLLHISRALNHSSLAVTQRYVTTTQGDLDRLTDQYDFSMH